MVERFQKEAPPVESGREFCLFVGDHFGKQPFHYLTDDL